MPNEPVEHRTPRDDAMAKEDGFGDDYDARAIDAIRRVLTMLAPKNRGHASVVSTGYRVIALAILMRRETRSCETIAKELGCTRAIISHYVRKMSVELGIQSPDRTAEAIKTYQKRQRQIWQQRLGAKATAEANTEKHGKNGQKQGKTGGRKESFPLGVFSRVRQTSGKNV